MQFNKSESSCEDSTLLKKAMILLGMSREELMDAKVCEHKLGSAYCYDCEHQFKWGVHTCWCERLEKDF